MCYLSVPFVQQNVSVGANESELIFHVTISQVPLVTTLVCDLCVYCVLTLPFFVAGLSTQFF